MWLVFVWLAVGPDLDHPPEAGISGSIYDLSQRIGSIWVAIAAGVVAYLIGSVSQDASRGLRRLWIEFGPELPAGRFRIQSNEQLEAAYLKAKHAIEVADLPPELRERLKIRLEDRGGEARFEARRELELPATLLVGDQSELFAEVDRLRAEGELRMAVVPPLIVLTAYLTLESSFWWLFLAPLAVVLFFQGLQRELDSKKSIADAIWIGRVKSSSSSKFSQWVDDVLLTDLQQAIDSFNSR